MRSAALIAAVLLALPGPGAAAAGASPDVVQAAERREHLEAELEEVARRIEIRKRAARKSRLPDGELERLLQRSQSLAAELSALHRAGRPVTRPKAPAEDPDELREQADLLRDQRDRVVARLRLVHQRLEEARADELLAAELRAFIDEGELFDDGERVMRAGRTITRAIPGGQPAPSPSAPAPGAGASLDAGEGRGPDQGLGSSNDGAAPGLPPAAITTHRITGTRPLDVGGVGTRRIPTLEGDESLIELVEQQRALEQLAAELEKGADDLERRARSVSEAGE